MDMGLRGKVVLVTGSTTNIGRGIALAFAGEGARVIVTGRDAKAGAQVVSRAREQGAQDVLWIAADLMQKGEAERLATSAVERWGAIDILVNNVGGNATVAPFVETDEEDWRYDLDINVMTMLRLTRAVLAHMIDRGEGRIINIGSTSGVIGDPFIATYSAAKAAVHGFTRVLAAEVGVHNITVNAIAPFATRPADPDETASSGSRSNPETGLFRTLPSDRQALLGSIFRSGVLPRKAATTDEIGAAAVYLASKQAAFITGETLHVEGGVRLGWTHPDLQG